MPDKEEINTYKKIASGAKSFSRSRLYQTSDHLLSVSGSYIEEYRRFYFQDIKAALVHEQRSKTAMLGVITGLILIITIIGIISKEPDFQGVAFFTGILSVLLLAMLIPKLVEGGFAELYLITQIQSVQIEAITSLKKAEKVIELIRSKAGSDYGDIHPSQYRESVAPQVPRSQDSAKAASRQQSRVKLHLHDR